MTGAAPGPLAEAAIGAACLQLLGAALALGLLRGRQRAWCLASGLLWGAALAVPTASALVLARGSLGLAPLYPARLVAALTVAGALAAVTTLQVRARSFPAGRSGLLAAQLGVAALVGLAAACLARIDLASLTPDSLAIIESALGLARVNDPALTALSFLGSRGLFGVVLHAPAGSGGFDFLSFATPLAALSCTASLAAAVAGPALAAGRSPRGVACVVGVGLLWLTTCYFWLYQFFYVHVNLLAASYLLLFFVTARGALVERDDRWLVLAAIALFAFQMLRVEGAFFAAIFVGLLVLERAAEDRPAAPELALLLPGAAWCALLAGLVESSDAIASPALQLGMAALLLGCGALAAAVRRAPAAWRGRLPAAAVLLLAAGLLLLVALRPAHMLGRIGVLAGNATATGLWSGAWMLACAVVLAGPLLGRVPHQRAVLLGLAGYAIGLLGLTWFGYWREGWYDSGNRLLTLALPAFVWISLLRCTALLRSDADTRPQLD